jgi:hypothetical protein
VSEPAAVRSLRDRCARAARHARLADGCQTPRYGQLQPAGAGVRAGRTATAADEQPQRVLRAALLVGHPAHPPGRGPAAAAGGRWLLPVAEEIILL